jgi:hypothetical protein
LISYDDDDNDDDDHIHRLLEETWFIGYFIIICQVCY